MTSFPVHLLSERSLQKSPGVQTALGHHPDHLQSPLRVDPATPSYPATNRNSRSGALGGSVLLVVHGSWRMKFSLVHLILISRPKYFLPEVRRTQLEGPSRYMQDPQGFCAKEEGIAGGWGVSNSSLDRAGWEPYSASVIQLVHSPRDHL